MRATIKPTADGHCVEKDGGEVIFSATKRDYPDRNETLEICRVWGRVLAARGWTVTETKRSK